MLNFIQQIDNYLLNLIHNYLHTPLLDSFFIWFTQLGNGKFLWILISLLLFIKKKTRNCGMLLCVGILVSTLIGEEILKPLIGRLRPFISNPNINLLIQKPWGYSCPSSHTLDAFICSTILYHFYKPFGIASFVLAILMGFSRLYLYVHYPTDVMVGALLGIVFGTFIYKYSSISEQ